VAAAVVDQVVALERPLEVQVLEALLQRDKVPMVLLVQIMVMVVVEAVAVPAVQMEQQVKVLAQPAVEEVLAVTEQSLA
jgi:hypothetical protein